MNDEKINSLYHDAVKLLQQLISIVSLSTAEDKTADRIADFFATHQIKTERVDNNIWCVNKFYDPQKPCILLNSHHDTVPPSTQYTLDPFLPKIEEGKLYGLGSTDAGASLVALIAAFIYFYPAEQLHYNIIFAASAEEEVSGKNGIEKLFLQSDFNKNFTNKKSFAIVGEPTQLELAIAEKGLMVLDVVVHGKAGHAARDEGDNAIYKAMQAIEWFKQYRFQKISPLLGEVKMSVTSINSPNTSHNIVPASCSFVVDIRVTEMYTHQQIIHTIKENIVADITPRSTRLKSSSIPVDHPIVQAGIGLGKKTYGSPTLSDQALIPLPSLKCGPGFSAQSHSANEFVLLKDLEDGIKFYIELLQKIV